MLWLNIIIGIILFILLILLIPVGVRASYSDDLLVKLKIGFVSIRLYPPKPKKPKKKKEPSHAKEKEKKEKKKKPSLLKEKGVSWFVELIKQAAILAGGVLKDFFRHLVIKSMQISITYVGEDAQDTAVKYGYFCLAVYPSVSILAQATKCRHYGVDIAPNFDSKAKSVYFADVWVSIRVLWVVGLVFKYGFRIIKILLALRRGDSSELEDFTKETNNDSDKGECDMDHPIGNLMNITMDKIREMVDVNTIVGEPITSPDGTLIIPVSKVSYGFASGGSDLPTKKENKDCFGGGSGAGVTIQPVAFLTVHEGNVRLINVNGENSPIDGIINAIPNVVETVKGIVSNRKKNKEDALADDISKIDIDDLSEVTVDDFSEITADDIDV